MSNLQNTNIGHSLSTFGSFLDAVTVDKRNRGLFQKKREAVKALDHMELLFHGVSGRAGNDPVMGRCPVGIEKISPGLN